MQTLIRKLPDLQKAVFLQVGLLLNLMVYLPGSEGRVVERTREDEMTSERLAAIWGPLILRPPGFELNVEVSKSICEMVRCFTMVCFLIVVLDRSFEILKGCLA